MNDKGGDGRNFERLGLEITALYLRSLDEVTWGNTLEDASKLLFYGGTNPLHGFLGLGDCNWNISCSRDNGVISFEEYQVSNVHYERDPYPHAPNARRLTCSSREIKYNYNYNDKLAVAFVGYSDKGIVLMPAISYSVSYTHLRAHETPEHLVCRLLLE